MKKYVGGIDMTKYYKIAKEFGLKYIEPIAKEIDETNKFPEEIIELLGKHDFLKLNVPSEYGGLDEGFEAFVDCVVAFTEYSAAVGIIYTMHGLLVWRLKNANTKLKDIVYNDIVKNYALGADGTSEAKAGVNIENVYSTAVALDDDIYELNGTKHMVTSGGYAKYYTFITNNTDTNTVGTWIIPLDAKGLSFKSNQWDGLGFRGNESCPMVLKDVKLDNIWYAGNNTSVTNPDYQNSLNAFHLGLASLSVGLNLAICSATLNHILNRKLPHGKSLADVETARLAMGEIFANAVTSQEALLSISRLIDEDPKENQLSLLSIRISAAEKVLQSAALAKKLGGGKTYNRKNKIERLFRDAQAADILVPGVDRLKLMIADALR